MIKRYVPLGTCAVCRGEYEVYGDPDVVRGPGEEELTEGVDPSEVKLVEHMIRGSRELPCPGSHRHPVSVREKEE